MCPARAFSHPNKVDRSRTGIGLCNSSRDRSVVIYSLAKIQRSATENDKRIFRQFKFLSDLEASFVTRNAGSEVGFEQALRQYDFFSRRDRCLFIRCIAYGMNRENDTLGEVVNVLVIFLCIRGR